MVKSFGRRAWFLLGLGVLAVPLVGAALAYGCTAAATLSADSGAAEPGTAPAGSTVTITGKYFGTHDPEDVNSNQPVQIRIGTVTGAALANALPAGPERSFSVRVTIPGDIRPGDSFISATQLRSDGRPVYGTPARQAFRVTPAPAPPPAPSSGAPASSGGPVANKVAARRLATLSMASAARRARASILRKKPRAKRVRTSCARRSRTTVVCRVRYKLGSKSYSRKVVVRSRSASAASW